MFSITHPIQFVLWTCISKKHAVYYYILLVFEMIRYSLADNKMGIDSLVILAYMNLKGPEYHGDLIDNTIINIIHEHNRVLCITNTHK